MTHFYGIYCLQFVAVVFLGRVSSRDSATAPGDIIIGGLFPIHESVEPKVLQDGREIRVCNRFSAARLVQSLVMVQTVEEVNQWPELKNLTLGYCILDSCSDVTTALERTYSFMRRASGDCNEDTSGGGNRTECPAPPVLAVVGDYHSEISIAVARNLNLEHIPQISYGATSGILSDKTRFPGFFRTVPEDDPQAFTIVQILAAHNWTWVGVVTTDGEYGRYILDRFQYYADIAGICSAFTVVLPDVLGDTKLKDSVNKTVNHIVNDLRVKAIVSFAKPDHMMYVFASLLKDPRGRGKVWVASNNWSASSRVLGNWTLSDVGTVIGVTLRSANAFSFKQYLNDLDTDPDAHRNNSFLRRFLLEHRQKQQREGLNLSHTPRLVKRQEPVRPNDTANEVLWKRTYGFTVFSVGLAVRAIAQAVVDLCANRDCKEQQRLQPWELREALKNTTFHMDRANYKFDDQGNLNTGYDVTLWQKTTTTPVDVHYIVARYSLQDNKLTFISQQTAQDVFDFTGDVVSRCSNSCAPGKMRRSTEGKPVCCYDCVTCSPDHFSNQTDSDVCHRCDTNTHYSLWGSAQCTKKTAVFFTWIDIYANVLLALAVLGILLTLLAGIIFFIRWNTPVVRSSVGPISLLILLSLLGTFVSAVLFVGRPTWWQCQARQVLFGLSFTLCISCILVKSSRIILAFGMAPGVNRVLKKLHQPYVLIGICLSLQVIICALWLALKPPQTRWNALKDKRQRLFECDERSFEAFGAMLGYIGLLALIGFVCAFKGRKLPNNYNEAKFITFGMVIYFICWIIFGPVYATTTGPYLPAVEMVVILLSGYGILCCHFLPKCYIILFKKKMNTAEAFQQERWNYVSRDVQTQGQQSRHSSLDQSAVFNSQPLHIPKMLPTVSQSSTPSPTESWNQQIITLRDSLKVHKRHASLP